MQAPYALPELELLPWSEQVFVQSRVVMEGISDSLLGHVQREGESLQAALWPPSAKALTQGVGQRESGFLENQKLQDFPVANTCTLTVSGFFLLSGERRRC